MYAALDVSLLLVLVLAVPAAGFLVRTFIVFHDCAHGSFLPWRRANHWLGIACGLVVYSPFHIWRHEHAVHHASAGDLDRRGRGDVETLTVAEWVALSRPKRLAYRTFRNPLVMLGLGPIWALMIAPRLVPGWARARFGRTIIATNVALAALLVGLCALVGWRAVLVVQLPTAMLAGALGIWMFYVQHQFEDVYWERKEDWSYAEAALRGSSYLKLPRRPSVLHRQHRPAPRPPPERPHPQLQPPARPRREPGLPRRAPTERLGRRPRPTAQALRRRPRPDGHLPRGAPRARHSRDYARRRSSRVSVLSRAGAMIARKALERVATRTTCVWRPGRAAKPARRASRARPP